MKNICMGFKHYCCRIHCPFSNSLTFHWLLGKSSFSLTSHKIHWLFTDLEKIFFSLTYPWLITDLSLVQIMAWHRRADKPLCAPMSTDISTTTVLMSVFSTYHVVVLDGEMRVLVISRHITSDRCGGGGDSNNSHQPWLVPWFNTQYRLSSSPFMIHIESHMIWHGWTYSLQVMFCAGYNWEDGILFQWPRRCSENLRHERQHQTNLNPPRSCQAHHLWVLPSSSFRQWLNIWTLYHSWKYYTTGKFSVHFCRGVEYRLWISYCKHVWLATRTVVSVFSARTDPRIGWWKVHKKSRIHSQKMWGLSWIAKYY